MSLVLVGGMLAVTASVGAVPTREYLMDGHWARWNEDGTRIVYLLDTIYSNKGRPNVFTADADGSDATQVTYFRGNEAFGQYGNANGPSFRTDSDNIYWRDDVNGAWYTAFATQDGTGTRTLTSISGHNTPVRFSASGDQFAYGYYLSGTHHIYVGTPDATTGSLSRGTSVKSFSSNSLNGLSGNSIEWGYGYRANTLVYSRRDNGVYSIFSIQSNAVGGAETRLTPASIGDAFDPVWSPDGKTVFFRCELNEQWDIWSLDLDTQTYQRWTNDADDELYPAISPDGSQLMFSVYDAQASLDSATNIYQLYTVAVPEPSTAGIVVLLSAIALTRRPLRRAHPSA